MSNPVYVVTSAYGADQVRASGQIRFIALAAEAGAQGVEIRRELFDVGTRPLGALREQLQARRMHSVYSVPEPLWTQGGALDVAMLTEALNEAEQLGARFLKCALGHYSRECDLASLASCLRERQTRLLVENDQTPHGGSIERLAAFFEAAEAIALPVGMTFDTGNWFWSGQSSRQAAAVLARHVEYIHCKGVRLSRKAWEATQPENGFDDWRAVMALLPESVPRGIEFPLQGKDLPGVTRHYVELLGEGVRQ